MGKSIKPFKRKIWIVTYLLLNIAHSRKFSWERKAGPTSIVLSQNVLTAFQ